MQITTIGLDMYQVHVFQRVYGRKHRFHLVG
jgi:hypothetical protein